MGNHGSRVGPNKVSSLHKGPKVDIRYQPHQLQGPPLYKLQKTIYNQFSLKKATLRLEEDNQQPGCHLVAFSFDSSAAGRVSIFFIVKEDGDTSLIPQLPDLYEPVRGHFEKGLKQEFCQAPGTGINLASLSEHLARASGNETFALVIRAETAPESSSPPRKDRALVHTTYAQIELKEAGVRVLKEMIQVDGMRYELQDVIRDCGGSTTSVGSGEKNCVICMCKPRNVTMFPCRHLCICHLCTEVFRFQSNLCPICRCEVEKFVEMPSLPQKDVKVVCSHNAQSCE